MAVILPRRGGWGEGGESRGGGAEEGVGQHGGECQIDERC